jgi:hypothetical protein
MKKIVLSLFIFGNVFLFSSCENNDCDPGNLPIDDNLYLNILNTNGSSFIKYTNNAIPDSVRVTNLSTSAIVTRNLFLDSILAIPTFDKTANAVTRFKISKGTILKPDTIEVTMIRTVVNDNCGTSYDVARIGQIKVNGVVKCTNCTYNTALTYTR